MNKRDFLKPMGLVNLEKMLTVKEIKYILNNKTKTRNDYNNTKELLKKNLKISSDIDFDSIEAFETIFKYSKDDILINKTAKVFNEYVTVSENFGLNHTSEYVDDGDLPLVYSSGYTLEPHLSTDIKKNLISISKKVLEEYEQKLLY